MNRGHTFAEERRASEGPPTSEPASGGGQPPQPLVIHPTAAHVPRHVEVFGTGRHYFWGRRDDALAIWSFEPTWSVVDSFPLYAEELAVRRFLALERSRRRGPARWVADLRARPRGRSHRTRFWLTIGVSGLTLTILALLPLSQGSWGISDEALALQSGQGSLGPSFGVPSRPASPPRGERVYVDAAAGYRFLYPDTWRRSGSTIVAPDGDVVISLLAAPSGPLEHVSRDVVNGLTTNFTDVAVVSSELERTRQGRPALAVGIEAADRRARPVRLLAITVRGPEHSAVMAVRFSAGSDPRDALPVIQKIVASFRIL